MNISTSFLFSLLGTIFVLTGCQPTVKLEAPEKPIVVNMNVAISVKAEKDIEKAIKNNPDIF